MAKYEVKYSVWEENRPGHAGRGSSLMQNLKITIDAPAAQVAQKIVESMFGGPDKCSTYGAIKVSN